MSDIDNARDSAAESFDNNNMSLLAQKLLKHVGPDQFDNDVTFRREGPAERHIDEDVELKPPKFGVSKLHLNKTTASEKIHFHSRVDDNGVSLTKIHGLKLDMQILGEVPIRELHLSHNDKGERVVSANLEIPIWARVATRGRKFFPYSVTLSASVNSPEEKLIQAYKEQRKLAAGKESPIPKNLRP